MTNFLANFKKEEGASAILVIVMMVVLLVFGLAVVTTSLSNVRLGERKQAWLSEYYELEAAAEKELAWLDALLLQAEADAKAYMLSDDYIDDYMLDSPGNDAASVAAIKAQVFALSYDDFMMSALSEAIMGNEEMVFYHGEQDLDAVFAGQALRPSRLEFSVNLPESNYDKHIQVTVELLCADGDNLSDSMSLNKRYVISRHTQQQEAFQYDESLDFENPFEEDSMDANPFNQ